MLDIDHRQLPERKDMSLHFQCRERKSNEAGD